MYLSTLYLFSDTPEAGIRSHYRWLWVTMWLLGFKLRSSGRGFKLYVAGNNLGCLILLPPSPQCWIIGTFAKSQLKRLGQN